jgi:hypothetical protein
MASKDPQNLARISVATIPVEGRDLSSRQMQDVVKDLRDWATNQLRKCSKTAEGVAREGVKSCPRAGCRRACPVR